MLSSEVFVTAGADGVALLKKARDIESLRFCLFHFIPRGQIICPGISMIPGFYHSIIRFLLQTLLYIDASGLLIILTDALQASFFVLQSPVFPKGQTYSSYRPQLQAGQRDSLPINIR